MQLRDWEFSHTQGFNLGKGHVQLVVVREDGRGEVKWHNLSQKSTFPKLKFEACGINDKCLLIPWLQHKPLWHSGFSHISPVVRMWQAVAAMEHHLPLMWLVASHPQAIKVEEERGHRHGSRKKVAS